MPNCQRIVGVMQQHLIMEMIWHDKESLLQQEIPPLRGQTIPQETIPTQKAGVPKTRPLLQILCVIITRNLSSHRCSDSPFRPRIWLTISYFYCLERIRYKRGDLEVQQQQEPQKLCRTKKIGSAIFLLYFTDNRFVSFTRSLVVEIAKRQEPNWGVRSCVQDLWEIQCAMRLEYLIIMYLICYRKSLAWQISWTDQRKQ